MTSDEMNVERVFELIAAFGAEPGGWPEEEREAAKELISVDPDTFADVLSEARALDEILLRETAPEPSAALAQAILAAAPEPTPERAGLLSSLSSIVFPRGVRWPAGAALASLVMGLVGGYAYASGGIGYDEADQAYYLAFGVDSSESWLSLE